MGAFCASRRRQLPQGPSVWDKMAPREGAMRDVEPDCRLLGLQSTPVIVRVSQKTLVSGRDFAPIRGIRGVISARTPATEAPDELRDSEGQQISPNVLFPRTGGPCRSSPHADRTGRLHGSKACAPSGTSPTTICQPISRRAPTYERAWVLRHRRALHPLTVAVMSVWPSTGLTVSARQTTDLSMLTQ